jgi:hypothetical protein
VRRRKRGSCVGTSNGIALALSNMQSNIFTTRNKHGMQQQKYCPWQRRRHQRRCRRLQLPRPLAWLRLLLPDGVQPTRPAQFRLKSASSRPTNYKRALVKLRGYFAISAALKNTGVPLECWTQKISTQSPLALQRALQWARAKAGAFLQTTVGSGAAVTANGSSKLPPSFFDVRVLYNYNFSAQFR